MTGDEVPTSRIDEALARRFGAVPPAVGDGPVLSQLVGHRSHRRFTERGVDDALVRLVCAAGLSAPSKSDLQQCDIVVVSDPEIRHELDALMPQLSWLPGAPAMVVICGNNRRQRLLHERDGVGFPNDHLDAFFNTATDAALVLGWTVLAAQSQGLGCCPLSAIRDRADDVAALLRLPVHVFPHAGLAIGWPVDGGEISPRLPLAVTMHTDVFDDTGLEDRIAEYDERRRAIEATRDPAADATPPPTWSDAKVRQYSRPQRTDFGTYVRRIGFSLD